MPQFPNPGSSLSPSQVDALRALLPTAGDPPAVAQQKQAALKEVVTRLRGSGVAMSDQAPPPPAPGLFGGGRPGGGGATGSWEARISQAVDAAAASPAFTTSSAVTSVPPGWHDPNKGDDIGDVPMQRLGGPPQ